MNAPALTGKLVYFGFGRSSRCRVASGIKLTRMTRCLRKSFRKRRKVSNNGFALQYERNSPLFGRRGIRCLVFSKGKPLKAWCAYPARRTCGCGAGVWHWRLKMLLTAGFVRHTATPLEKERLNSRSDACYGNTTWFHLLAVHPRYQQKGLGDLLVKAVAHELQSDEQSEGVLRLFATRAAIALKFFWQPADIKNWPTLRWRQEFLAYWMFLSREAQSRCGVLSMKFK